MAKPLTSFVCQNCGAASRRWHGRCDSCGGWNTFAEELAASGIGALANHGARKGRIFELSHLAESGGAPTARLITGIAELDRVVGGGFVPGSVLLLGGEPGIGKSTLLIEACAKLASQNLRTVYISGEEAVEQVRMRAARLGLASAPVELAAETNVEDITATLSRAKQPVFAVVDSIQTMWTGLMESAPGAVGQVRAAAQALIHFAKTSGAVVMLVGHITKDGQIAGPRVVEHMVDVVISFEGEHGRGFRILRAAKNRFGPTDEIGVFEMTARGLAEIGNPSALFLSSRDIVAPGAAVFAGMEGTRPLLVEFQALAVPSPLGVPRRAAVGWDGARLAMVLAVLEARAGLRLGQHDVYLNIAGGLRITEPAADFAAAAALVSSVSGTPLPAQTVFFGEIALSGAVRPVPQSVARLKEAAKLGFTQAFLSQGAGENGSAVSGLALRGCAHVSELAAFITSRSEEGTSEPPGTDFASRARHENWKKQR